MLLSNDHLCILRFAASFLWADLTVGLAEHAFFVKLAEELGISREAFPSVVEMLAAPPPPEDVDPTHVSTALARTVRDVALRAIASDGRVLPQEMELFDLLDELLPGAPDEPASVTGIRSSLSLRALRGASSLRG